MANIPIHSIRMERAFVTASINHTSVRANAITFQIDTIPIR